MLTQVVDFAVNVT